MARAWKYRDDDLEVSALWCPLMLMAGAACLFLVLHAIYRPHVIPNPGLAAYRPPPGTRLIPLPRDLPVLAEADVPMLDEVPTPTPDPSTAMAQAKPDDKPAKHEAHPRKHQRLARERKPGDAQQRNYGVLDRTYNQAWQIASRPWF
jgi:hypothetical protein